MDGYLVVKGPEAKLKEYIVNFRARPPAGYVPREFQERILGSSGLDAETYVDFDTPDIHGCRYDLSLIITLSRLRLLTIYRAHPDNGEVEGAREQLRVIHRFYTDCLKEFVAEHSDLEIEKFSVDVDPEDPDLAEPHNVNADDDEDV